mmetsp:Transcript_8308/g.21191  ORF Transcript_8308/g.21191 Transcript_8308/m.21191 type:complete len:227 (+) Transcript_8308:443-1123(+)
MNRWEHSASTHLIPHYVLFWATSSASNCGYQKNFARIERGAVGKRRVTSPEVSYVKSKGLSYTQESREMGTQGQCASTGKREKAAQCGTWLQKLIRSRRGIRSLCTRATRSGSECPHCGSSYDKSPTAKDRRKTFRGPQTIQLTAMTEVTSTLAANVLLPRQRRQMASLHPPATSPFLNYSPRFEKATSQREFGKKHAFCCNGIARFTNYCIPRSRPPRSSSIRKP